DHDLCDGEEACAGVLGCQEGEATSCDDANACTDDSCDAERGCTHTDNTNPCDDGSVCTSGDSCDGGLCVGGLTPDCNDGNSCTDDSCNPQMGCFHVSNSTCGANPKGQGYWKRLGRGPHPSGDFFTAMDIDCVSNSCALASVS